MNTCLDPSINDGHTVYTALDGTAGALDTRLRGFAAVDEETKPHKVLVRVDPPVPGYLCESTADLNRLVLAPRHKGASIYPEVSEWPCHVHVCLPKEGGSWDRGLRAMQRE